MNRSKIFYLITLWFLSYSCFSQEGIAVYSDYLTDNYYLLHPSMAGAANCAKIRATGRRQWFDQSNAPQLNTVSFNGRVGDQSGLGAIFFSDENGYHSQRGAKLTYAHHIMFSRNEIDLNQLSFGISGALVQSQLDETTFINGQPFDPIIGGIYQKDSYFNVDLGVSYNYLDFYAHYTVRNAITNIRREIYTEFESDNLRKHLFHLGYNFGDSETLLIEPSILYQFTEKTREQAIDINMKVYKDMEFGRLWGGLSYRRSFDGAQFVNGNAIDNQKLQWFSPLIGINYDKFMFAYTYSYIAGEVNFDNAGFHQITIGIDLFCKREKFECNCPAIN